jgi:hypothetical protein
MVNMNDGDNPTAREAHRALVLERANLVPTFGPFTQEARDEAIRRLEERLTDGPWNGDRYMRRRRRFRPAPIDLGHAPIFPCDLAELIVVQLLGRTWPKLQFSVTPKGDVFAGDQLGYHSEISRIYVTALSPILDDAADVLLRDGGVGGRLYVHGRSIERAGDKTLLARLEASDWPEADGFYY